MSSDNDLRDCSRAWLEAAAKSLQAMVDIGYRHLQPRLDAIRAQIPHAPEYDIDHKDRNCRRS